MADLRTFSARIAGVGVSLKRDINTLVQAVATAATQAVILDTPVDKGDARSNWRVSLDAPDFAVVPAHSPGRYLGLSETANAAAAIQAAQRVIEKRQTGQDIYIQNNVPYIELLNNGHSKQAPVAFVEKAVLAGVAAIDKGVISVSPTRVI